MDLAAQAERFRAALAFEEGDAEIRLRVYDELGAIYRGMREYGKAVETYEAMFQVAALNDNLDGKVTALQNMIVVRSAFLDPSADVLALYEEYHVALRQAPPELMETYAQRLIDSYSERALYRMKLADVASSADVQRQLLEEAASDFVRFVENAGPESVNKPDVAKYHLAAVYADLGQSEKAATVYDDRAANGTSVAPSWMFHEGLKLRLSTRSGQYQEALRTYLDTQEQDDYFRPLMQALAMSYLNTQQGSKAIPILEELMPGSPSWEVQAYNTYMLGAAYIDSGQIDRGIAILRDLIDTWPDSPSAKAAARLISRTNKGYASVMEELDSLTQNSRASH